MRHTSLLLLLLTVLSGAASGPGELGLRHFALSKSAPAADAAVPAPQEVRLWFTQVPQENSMSIRVIEGERPIETGDAVSDPDDGKVFSVAIEQPLAPGSYTVAWRAIGEDGHVVRGDFAFSVELP